MVLLASLCVPLIFLYLTRLGAERWAALLAEGVHPPWWLSIPFAAGRASELRFVLTSPQDVYCLFHYDGPADLTLTDIVLYRETFDQR